MTEYYDWHKHPFIEGYSYTKGCKYCSESFNQESSCSCYLVHVMPDPRTIPENLLTDELRKEIGVLNKQDELNKELNRIAAIRVCIKGDKVKFYKNLRNKTEGLFRAALERNLNKVRTKGELVDKGFIAESSRYNIYRMVGSTLGKFRIELYGRKHSIIVSTVKPLKRLTRKSLISSIEVIYNS